jgi:hypothetical protein
MSSPGDRARELRCVHRVHGHDSLIATHSTKMVRNRQHQPGCDGTTESRYSGAEQEPRRRRHRKSRGVTAAASPCANDDPRPPGGVGREGEHPVVFVDSHVDAEPVIRRRHHAALFGLRPARRRGSVPGRCLGRSACLSVGAFGRLRPSPAIASSVTSASHRASRSRKSGGVTPSPRPAGPHTAPLASGRLRSPG